MKNDNLAQKLNSFKSVRELLKVFSTEKKCENFLKKVRWGEKVVSPYDETAKVYVCSRNRYRCAKTKKDFNVKTGTMFEKFSFSYPYPTIKTYKTKTTGI